MANEVIQKGETLLIGCNGITYEGTIMEDVTFSEGADIESNKGDNGETVNKTISDLRTEVSFTATIKGTSFTSPRIGDIVTVNSVGYMTTKADVKYSKAPKASQFSFTGIKEDSMTYGGE